MVSVTFFMSDNEGLTFLFFYAKIRVDSPQWGKEGLT